MSDRAIIARLENVRPHSNADRLNLATVSGFQIIVGKDHQEGELGIFFNTDTQLSQEYCEANDLLARYDEAGNKIGGGLFDHKRRVRAQRLRGERSDGFWMPLASLDAMKPASEGDLEAQDILSEGDTVSEIWGIEICRRYETEGTRRFAAMQAKQARQPRGETKTFKKLPDTEQLRFYSRDIPVGARLIFSLKMHGTSQREGTTWETWQETAPIELPWWKRAVNRVFPLFPAVQTVDFEGWRWMLGTRNVIIGDGTKQGGYYGSDDFRFKVALGSTDKDTYDLPIKYGETLYYEVVGWVDEQRPIMEPQSPGDLRDKRFLKQYGDKMIYSYGTEPGECDIYLYRMTRWNPETQRTEEVPWEEMEIRADEMGIKTVPLLLSTQTYDGDEAALLALCEQLREGPDPIDPRHIREGVVVRVETVDSAGNLHVDVYKDKSHTFGMLEGYIKEREDVVDIEEAA